MHSLSGQLDGKGFFPSSFFYRKIPKISPGGWYLSKALFEGLSLIFGSILTVFDLFYFVFEGGLYLEGLIFWILRYLIIQPMAILFRFDRLDSHTLADMTLYVVNRCDIKFQLNLMWSFNYF